jgi:hypothetical protein
MIHQNVPHQLRGYSEKVCAVLPLRRFLANQAQVCLVNQARALEGVVGTFAPQMAARDPAQFIVNDGYERFPRFFVATAPIGEQSIDPRGRSRTHVSSPAATNTAEISEKVQLGTSKVNLPGRLLNLEPEKSSIYVSRFAASSRSTG